MDTKIIELRMAVRALPTDSREVQLAVKSEVLRLAELLDKQLRNLTPAAPDAASCPKCGGKISVSGCVRCGYVPPAAPELLEALDALLQDADTHHGHLTQGSKYIGQARAAIAKAQG